MLLSLIVAPPLLGFYLETIDDDEEWAGNDMNKMLTS